MKKTGSILALLLIATALPQAARSQSVTLPPSGDNQKASVSQSVGLVKISIDYSSPRVHRTEDRTGKIWGELVPYGLSDLGFNGCKQCPWRAGANENTVVTVSHDLKVEGKALPKGSYGLHMIPGKETFTIIFSKHAGSWGSYWYDPKEDALRVDVKPVKNDFREWLTYEFTEREPSKATVALMWENLKIPFTFTVDDITDLYIKNLRSEIHGNRGFQWQELQAAAQYCVQQGKNLDEALDWAQRAVSVPFIGDENFTTLSTLAEVQAALGKAEEAEKTFDRAISNPTAKPIPIHLFGRQLLQQGKKAQALRVFQANAKRFPGQWPVNVGLARGYEANGEAKKALEYARLALPQAPDEQNKSAIKAYIEQLEKGKSPS